MSIELSAALEDYLERIYLIEEKKHAARAKDIAMALDVRASSVTSALRNLSALGLVNYAPYDIITLTDKGKVMAQEIFSRHTALRNFLEKVLGVDAEEADRTACKMEHAVSRAVMERFSKYADYVEQCPRGMASVGADFARFFAQNCSRKPKDCKQCTESSECGQCALSDGEN